MYLISVSVMAPNDKTIHVDIVKNGMAVTSLFGGFKDWQADTQAIVLDLQAGDMIWVRHRSGDAYVNEQIDTYNSYMAGFLIKQHV